MPTGMQGPGAVSVGRGGDGDLARSVDRCGGSFPQGVPLLLWTQVRGVSQADRLGAPLSFHAFTVVLLLFSGRSKSAAPLLRLLLCCSVRSVGGAERCFHCCDEP